MASGSRIGAIGALGNAVTNAAAETAGRDRRLDRARGGPPIHL
jgi:hypothetical protein